MSARKALRAEILRLLSDRVMTSEEIANELPDVKARAVAFELAGLVRADLVCARGDRSSVNHYEYETWERAIARIRKNSYRHSFPEVKRPARRIA